MIAALPARLHAVLPGALAYRPLFLLSAAGSLLCCALIYRTPDSETGPLAPASGAGAGVVRACRAGRTGWCCA